MSRSFTVYETLDVE